MPIYTNILEPASDWRKISMDEAEGAFILSNCSARREMDKCNNWAGAASFTVNEAP